ncbi:hypothetical protein V8D89_000034 [Ganoderma adspersum]
MPLDGPIDPDPKQCWRPLSLPSRLTPAGLHTQVRQRLSVLDSIGEAINEERSCLNMAWNRTLPINRLPNELLVSIFTQVADGIWVRRSCSLFVGRYHPDIKRTRLVLVCRYWRDVAYASPVLWRVIDIRSPEYTERSLILSAPATIDALFKDRQQVSKGLKLLRPHTHRLRSLHFTEMEQAWKSEAVALLQGDGGTPALESLELPFYWQKAWDPRNDEFVDLQLTPQRFPRLQSLAVTFTVAPEDLTVYARLRKLTLRNCRCDFSFDHFLDALNASTNLRGLVLESILHRIHGDWVASTVTNKGPVSLCHLESFTLTGHPPIYTSRFLSHILLSPKALVRIHSDLGNVPEMNPTQTIPDILPSNPDVVLPALALVKEAVIYALGSEYSLSCSIEPCAKRLSQSPLIALSVESSLISGWDLFSDHAARDLLRVFASSPLTGLDFAGDCGEVAAETWAEIFGKYAHLETLRLGIDGTVETVFAGLMDAAAGTPDSLVPCPKLRSIAVVGPFVETGVDVMLQCLRDRAGKGYRLQDVLIDLVGEIDHALMETYYIPELEGLVPDVKWSSTIREWFLLCGFAYLCERCEAWMLTATCVIGQSVPGVTIPLAL